MSFAQWNKNVSDSIYTSVALDLATPIGGLASVALNSVTASAALYLTPSNTSGFTKGIEKGKLRTLVNLKSSTSNGCGFGLVIMVVSETIVTTAGPFYRYELFSNGTYALARSNTNILNVGSPNVTLNSGSTGIAQNVTYGIEIEWVADPVNLGGVSLVIRKGTAIDFSNMVVLGQVLDMGAQVLGTSNSEGIYLRGYTSGGAVRVLFDTTQLYEFV